MGGAAVARGDARDSEDRRQKAGGRRQKLEGRRVMEEGRSGKWKYNEPITGGTPLLRGRPRLASGQVAGAAANRTNITKQSRRHPRAGCPCYGGALAEGAQGSQPHKKRVSFFTNEAIMLLKTKDRHYERSQMMAPMETTRKLAAAARHADQLSPRF
jgi:hypothetical protein